MAERSPLPARRDLSARGRRLARALGLVAGYGLVAAVLAAPLVGQRTVEDLSFADRLGSLPVEVGVVHNGYSVIDTGALGSIFLERTGLGGLGVSVRVTGPPDAGGTLASYVDPGFVQANTAVLTDIDETSDAYVARLRDDFAQGFLVRSALVLLVAGWLLRVRLHPLLASRGTRGRVVLASGVGLAVLAGSTGLAVWQHQRWAGSSEPETLYPMADPDWVSFDSPQAREVAVQVGPFIDKNLDRLREAADSYVRRARDGLQAAVAARADDLRPRDGERVVLAEADPQGSQVGSEVRRLLYAELDEALGPDAVAARTISGDVTSNGTVAEKAFVEDEVGASPEVPVVAVKGDHDSMETVDQLSGAGAETVDDEVVEVAGLRFAGAADPEFKSLFGGMVRNPSGVDPSERGAQLRETVDSSLDPGEAVHVIAHQNDMVEGYLGLDSITDVRALGDPQTSLTEPLDDSIPDLPPGSVSFGHWHEADGPWVVWNTDTEDVTWTLVDQLGTSGGVEASPTFNRFSTPYSPPLKPVEMRLHYVDEDTGLVTGYASVTMGLDATVTISPRTDVGVPLSR